jgi:hypothetical protein
MAEQDPQAQERDCKHYLWRIIQFSADGSRFWARCSGCRRAMLLGYREGREGAVLLIDKDVW